MPRTDRHRDDEFDDTPIRRRTRPPRGRSSAGRILVLTAAVAVVAGVVLAAVLAGGTRGNTAGRAASRPSAEVEGRQWDCLQLANYLNTRGLQITPALSGVDDVMKGLGRLNAAEEREAMRAEALFVSPRARGTGDVLCRNASTPESVARLIFECQDEWPIQIGWGHFWLVVPIENVDFGEEIAAQLAGAEMYRGRVRHR